MSYIGNTDDIPTNVDTAGNQTVNGEGTKTVLMKTTGHTIIWFNIVFDMHDKWNKVKANGNFQKKNKN